MMPKNNHSDNLFDGQAPMDDETLWDLLSLYVDGEADPAQAAIVEQMLSSDPAYRRDFDFLMQSSKTLHSVEEVAPPAGLRDAIYAATSRRPTLVGRLRAAWNRVTTPAFGRYATIGSAFAVAVLGAVIVWPHLSSSPGSGSGIAPVAIVTPPSHTHEAVAQNDTPAPRLPELDLSKLGFDLGLTHTMPFRQEARSTTPPAKPTVAPITHKAGEKPVTPEIAQVTPAPRNYAPPKTSTVRNDGVPTGYPYNKHMDNGVSPDRPQTIFASDVNELGTKVAVNDETPAPTPKPIEGVPISKSAGNNNNDPRTTIPEPVAPVKPRVRVAALPPEASQNIAANVIRHNIDTRYSGYGRSVAENIDRHEVTIDVIKGSF